MTQGESVPLDITVDGQAQFHLTGTASPVQVISILPVAVLNRLRKSSLMAVTGGSQTLQFALYSLDKIIPVIANCVDKVKSHGLASAGDFSIPPPKPPISATAARSTPDDAPPAKPQKLIRVNGTGFVVSANGYVVTNNHVIGQCVGDVHGNLTSETAGNMRIVSKDETNDLALLQASGSFKQTAIIRGQPAHPGDSVIAIGYPFHGLLTSDFTVTTGIVSSLSGILNDTRYLQISAPIQPGNSGGPLLDTSGYVVGVVAEKLNALKFARATGEIPENINFAIKTGALRDFLDNSAVPYQTAEPRTELKAADIASAARGYTMLISCAAKITEGEKK
jgi:S1-C subfamily serine protease